MSVTMGLDMRKVAPWNVANSELAVMLIALTAFKRSWLHDPETLRHLNDLTLRVRAELQLRHVNLDEVDQALASQQW